MIYAMYKGDKLIDFDYTLEGLSKRTGYTIGSIRSYMSRTKKKRKTCVLVYKWEVLHE